MGLTLQAAPVRLEGNLRLPGSKSSSNRWLILEALAGQSFQLHGLSSAEDTQRLQAELQSKQTRLQVGAAGTAMRFMTAYLAQKTGKYELFGRDRAHERPIAILVNALRALGADIQYIEKEGYPPLQITGKTLLGGTLKIDASVSSQYLTALLLIGCRLKEGLTLQWEGELSSAPYVVQTLAVLKQAGIRTERNEQQIKVYAGEINAVSVVVEPDWSSAGYWLAFACLLPTKLHLTALKSDTHQADKIALTYLAELGLNHLFDINGLQISRQAVEVTQIVQPWDFSDCPDLAPTLIVLCAALGQKKVFTGLKSLRIKESDRLLALQTELLKFGAQLHISQDSAVLVSGCDASKEAVVAVDSWQDHRLAMSLSLLSAVGYRLYFDQPQVVSKSYPSFWEDLAKFGFQLKK